MYSVAVSMTTGRVQYEKFLDECDAKDKLTEIEKAMVDGKPVRVNQCLVNPSHIVCAFIKKDNELDRIEIRDVPREGRI